MEPQHTGRRRTLGGTKEYLRNGGWIRLQPRSDNLAYVEKLRTLEAAMREAKGLSIEEKLGPQLTVRESTEMVLRAQIGTVVMEWGDFDDEAGREWPCRREDGSLDEDAGVALLVSPGVGADFMERLDEVDQRFARNVEIATKNSSTPSDGSSDTEG